MKKNMIIFLLGFFTATLMFYSMAVINTEYPFSFGDITGLTINEEPLVDSGLLNVPADRISKQDIVLTSNAVILNVEGASISSYAATGSMKPLLDQGSNGIRIQPSSEEDINVGDIISFEQEGLLKVHRVTSIGIDKKGTFYVTQGDNSQDSDGKIRFEDIRYITIGILW